MSEFMPATPRKPGDDRVYILGVELPKSTPLALAVVGVGIFTCYCLSGVAQEYLYSTGYEASSFLTLITKITAGIWGLGTVVITAGSTGLKERQCPHSAHALIGFLSFATMWLSNQSLIYLNYPTQSIFKSAKLIPVMLTSIIVLNKRYNIYDYTSAISLFLGLVSFTFGDVTEEPNFDILGVLYICGALCADAYIGNFQEKMFKHYKATSNEMMIYPNLYSAAFSLITALSGNEIAPAIQFITANPNCIQAIIAYSVLNIIGIYFVLASLERFGATTTTFVTSLRKAVSVIISFLLFTKPFSIYYAIGGVLTAAGIYLNVHAKQFKTSTTDKDKEKHVELSSIATKTIDDDTVPLISSNGHTHSNAHTNGIHTSTNGYHNGGKSSVIDDTDVDIDALMNSDTGIQQKIHPSEIQQWLKQADTLVNKQAKD